MTHFVDLLLQAKQNLEQLNQKALSMYSDAKNATEVEAKVQVSGTNKQNIFGSEEIANQLEQLILKDLLTVNLLNDKLYKRIYRLASDWKWYENLELKVKRKEMTEDFAAECDYKCATFQRIFLPTLINARQQQQMRAALIAFNNELKVGKQLLENKIKQLENDKKSQQGQQESQEQSQVYKKFESVDSYPPLSIFIDQPPKKNQAKIKLLSDVLKPSAPTHDLQNFNSLSSFIEENLKSNNPLDASILKKVSENFTSLVNNKIIDPLQKYDEERSFLSRFKEWASDLLKKTFGVGLLSTKGTLFKIVKDKDENLSELITKLNKKNKR